MSLAAHLHAHTQFSPLDGCGTSNQYTFEAVRKGQTHLAITDHGRLGGALEHVHACRHPELLDNPLDPTVKRSKDERLIPILGMEAFFRPDRFMELTDKEKYGNNPHNWAYHLTLHAASLEGWKTLMRLSSKAWVPREQGGGFYGKACIDWEMLEKDNKGIIISTGCVSSPLSAALIEGDEVSSRRIIKRFRDIVGDRLWGEIQPHDLEIQRTVNYGVVDLAESFGFGNVATQDVHIPYKDWADTHSVVRMASYRQTISSQEKKKDAGEDTYTEEIDSVYLTSQEEMEEMFDEYHPDLPEDVVSEAINNTEEFCKQVKWYVIGRSLKIPKLAKNETQAEKIILSWCKQGLKNIGKRSDSEYIDRKNYEFEVVRDKRAFQYYYLIGDIVRWCKSTDPLPGEEDEKKPIRVGLGRGSAAGSLISYLIGIVAIDPIAWGLHFERFLNPDRVGMPDIDIDFESDRLPEVKEYISRKHGREYVADVIAYQTFSPKVTIRTIGEVFDLDYFSEIKPINESIGDTERGLEKIVAGTEKIPPNEQLGKLKEKHPEVWKHALRLEEQVIRDTRHASAMVITPKPINEYMPTQTGSEGDPITAFADRADFPVISDYGFMKIDRLGVRGLDQQEEAVRLIGEYYDEEYEPNDLEVLHNPNAGDPEVLAGFTKGLTLGVFQFGSRGITQCLRHVKPTSAIDIAVVNALYRPGPMQFAFEFGDRKNGIKPVTYLHESLEPVLEETLGILAFQEQLMDICKVVGNFTGGQADSMRKAISKLYRIPGDKAQEYMREFYEPFMAGCAKNGIPEEDGDKMFNWMLPFGDYAFNKSHASSYSLQAYQDMDIKIKYPLAFYASLLTVNGKKKNAKETNIFLRSVMREARVLGVEPLPPDINRSRRGWIIDSGKIRYGMAAINDMGAKAADEIEALRKDKPFTSYKNFIKRMPSDFGSDMAAALAQGGAFDNIDDRKKLMSRVYMWPETKAFFKVKMDCGCNKTKTIKVEDVEDMEITIEETMDNLICESKKHPGKIGSVKEFEEQDSTKPYAQWLKDNLKNEPTFAHVPTDDELMKMEEEALNLPLTAGSIVIDYYDFIDSRVFSEEEFDELPSKPKRSGKKHGSYCSCKECEAAHVVVGGEVVNLKVINTKKGDKMCFVDVAFGTDQFNITVFPGTFERVIKYLQESPAVLIAGYKDTSRDKAQIIAYDVQDVRDVYNEVTKEKGKIVGFKSKKKVKRKAA